MKYCKRRLARKLLTLVAALAAVSLAYAQTATDGVEANLLTMARAGDAKSQLAVGFAYFNGVGMPIDLSEGVSWHRKAAENGDATAQYILGWEYYDGWGIAKDFALSSVWFHNAAEHPEKIDLTVAIKYHFLGISGIQTYFLLGNLYEDGKELPQDYSQAALWYRVGADLGEPTAQSSLGILYVQGKGVAQDFIKAAFWDRKAADQGFPDAEYNLAFLYEQGQGVIQDYAKAGELFEKAGKQGIPEAVYNLGVLYEYGKGFQQNSAYAFFLLDVVAAEMNGQEQANAAKLRDKCATEINEVQLKMAKENAESWLEHYPPRR
jgi:TPR repeat protein